jgi:DEAD/DEAH box helicase domain-containing protein
MDLNAFIEELKSRKDLKGGTGFIHHEVIPPVRPDYGTTKKPLSKEVLKALNGLLIKKLYKHQALGIDLVREDRNVVAMTPTASGKSLIYNIPVVEEVLKEPGSHALYLFPLKGLEQDQLKAFAELTQGLAIETPGSPEPPRTKRRRSTALGPCEIYDGDTTDYRRKRIRETPPPVVLTNPDMLHLAINAYHRKWEGFFEKLKFVVIDEIHTYRGVLGSHVAQVLKRMRRVSKNYGSEPRFIACSATIANPVELASMLTGVEFDLVDVSGAPQGKRNFLFFNPVPDMSPYTIALKLFIASVRAGFKTIAFTKARKITELMHTWVAEGAPDISGSISSYRAGFLPEERREIEGKLFAGELSGVISTSALELGVDIGGLDVCILVGYPGTISSTWQRAGRVGRKGRDSLIIMVAMEDALDQYFMRHPTDFFRRSVEAAVLDNRNETVLKAQLTCAVAELPLRGDESVFDRESIEPVLKTLEEEEKIRYWAKGDMWYPRKGYPHRDVSIREAGATFRIIKEDRTPLGEAASTRVLRELHPGAVYLHRGSNFRVVSLHMGNREVLCRAAQDITYYTHPITDEETEIIETEEMKKVRAFEVSTGKLRITETVLGYRKKEIHTRKDLGEFSLTLPPQVFTTIGIWMKVEEDIINEIGKKGFSVAGGLHALEHSAIATLPLFALCDRMDLGGVSYTFNPELESPAIFIYDGHEGGVGLTQRGFHVIEEWLSATMRLMQECTCEVSCPSCTQDPKCGNNNEPLDKRGALVILKRWL